MALTPEKREALKRAARTAVPVRARDIVERAFIEAFRCAEMAATCQTGFDTTAEEAWEASEAKRDAGHVEFDTIVYYEPKGA